MFNDKKMNRIKQREIELENIISVTQKFTIFTSNHTEIIRRYTGKVFTNASTAKSKLTEVVEKHSSSFHNSSSESISEEERNDST